VQEVIEFHDQSDGMAPPVQIDGGIVGPITWRAPVSGMHSASRPTRRRFVPAKGCG
jgi:hypothetical protein